MRFLTTMFNYIIEPFTKFISVIQSDHAYIHKGLAYTLSTDVGAISTTYYIGFTTPASTVGYIHFRPAEAGITTSTENVSYKLYENVAYTGGTTYIPFNRKRNSTNVSSVIIKLGVTATPGSALYIDNKQAGTAGNIFSASGGNSGGGDELILNPGTNYVFSFVPSGTTTIGFNSFWYEENEG